jgi:hypothetical protein
MWKELEFLKWKVSLNYESHMPVIEGQNCLHCKGPTRQNRTTVHPPKSNLLSCTPPMANRHFYLFIIRKLFFILFHQRVWHL